MNPASTTTVSNKSTYIPDASTNAAAATAAPADDKSKAAAEESKSSQQETQVPANSTERKSELDLQGKARSAELEASLNRGADAALPGKGFARLSAGDQKKLTDVMQGKQGAECQKALADLGASPKFQKLSPYLQQKTLELAARDPKSLNDTVARRAGTEMKKSPENLLQKLVDSDGFQKLDARHQIDALEVFEKSCPEGRDSFGDLAKRSITKDGKTIPALLDKDSRGSELIENLHHLATRDLTPHMMTTETKRQELLRSVCEESAKPGEIEQGHHGTCTVTTMQYMLCSQNPSEYVRIMDGLSTDGLVKLRNGETLRRVNDSMQDDTKGTRSPSERLFQAAMMDHCNGDNRRYSNELDKNGMDHDISIHGRKSVASLNDKEILHGMESLFGKQFHQVRDKEEAMKILMDRSNGSSDQDRQAKLAVSWPNQSSMHAVVFERIDEKEGRVYIRDSSGIRDLPKGALIPELKPATRVEDPANGVWSLSIADFKRIFVDVTVSESPQKH